MAVRTSVDAQLEAVELLGEPARRALYLFVVRQPGEVSRDQAAAAANVSRELAAYHLDKLVTAHLLEPVYRRLSGRTGPGAGRPAKLYRRAALEVAISLPPREYQLASRILARALGLADPESATAALDGAARQLGSELGGRAIQRAGRRASEARSRSEMFKLLEAHGYEPFTEPPGRVRLRNCPFQGLAAEFPEAVCAMNLALMEGIRAGAGVNGLRPQSEPAGEYCCVSFTN